MLTNEVRAYELVVAREKVLEYAKKAALANATVCRGFGTVSAVMNLSMATGLLKSAVATMQALLFVSDDSDGDLP